MISQGLKWIGPLTLNHKLSSLVQWDVIETVHIKVIKALRRDMVTDPFQTPKRVRRAARRRHMRIA
jgi:hypothetical protein